MDPSKLGDSLSNCFDSQKYSDITIRFSGSQIKAHKLVITQGSEYFKTCFDSKFKESDGTSIELHDDDPQAVKGLIAYLYGLSFDGHDAFTKHQHDPLCDDFGAEYVKYEVRLQVTAEKYFQRDLSSEIVRGFKSKVDKITSTSEYPQYLDQVARHVYIAHAEAATKLRPLVAKALVDNVGRMREDERFKQLLMEVPELAFAVVQLLAEDRTSKTEPSSSPAKLGKRPSSPVTSGSDQGFWPGPSFFGGRGAFDRGGRGRRRGT